MITGVNFLVIKIQIGVGVINNMKQHHTIEIFSANCPLCKHITEDIEIGKCKGCNQIIYNVNEMTNELKLKMKEYDIKAVPTTIIDGNIKIVGIPDFPWVCGDELYMKLTRGYSIQNNKNNNKV